MISFLHAHKFITHSPTNKMCEIYGISVPTTVLLMMILCMKRLTIIGADEDRRMTKDLVRASLIVLIVFIGITFNARKSQKRPKTF